MSRIRNAWRALMGAEPEVVVREVAGLPANVEKVTLYKHRVSGSGHALLSDGWYDRIDIHHLSCDSAFAAIPKADRGLLAVESVEAYRVGNRYFKASGLLGVSKPKRAKGAK